MTGPSVLKSGSRNQKKTGTEPDRTAKSRTRQLQFGVFRNKNHIKTHATGSVRVGCNRFTVLLKNAHILSLFWGLTDQNCMICGQNDMLRRNPTLCDFLYLRFWHLEVFYHHKNFIGDNYTLCTIVYYSLQPVWTGLDRFFSVLTGSGRNRFKPVRRSFLRFFAVPVRFFLYFRIRQPVAVAVRPKMEKKNRTGPDLKTLTGPWLWLWLVTVISGFFRSL